MRVLRVVRFVFFMLLFSACTMDSAYIDGIEEKIAQDKADSGDSGFLLKITEAGNGEVSLSWTEPSDSDYERILIRCEPGGQVFGDSAGTTSCSIDSLLTGTRYTFSSELFYSSGSSSSGNSVSITLPTDSTVINCISTYQELNDIRNNLNGYHIILNDIDLSDFSSGEGWEPIGSFSGTFDGNSRVLSNLVINRSSDSNLGLFSIITGSVSYLKITSADISGNSYLGILSGNQTGGSIYSCSVEGVINGQAYMGGLVGYHQSGAILYSSSDVSLNGVSYIGGLTGYSTSLIQHCFSNVTITATAGFNLGGLCGYRGANSIDNCYVKGTISGDSEIGGGVGNFTTNTMNNCYAAVSISGAGANLGGIVGTNSGMVNNSVYNKDLAGVSNGYGIEKTTLEMKSSTTFTTLGWDFSTTWSIDSSINDGYPYLQGWPP